VVVEEITPQPVLRGQDSAGNPLAVFSQVSLDPGKEIKLRIRFRVQTLHQLADLDWERLSIPSPWPEDLSAYLASSAAFPAADPRVKARARLLAGEETSPCYQALRLYDALRKMDFRLSLGPRRLAEVMDSGVVQCSDVVVYYVTLCRSLGIPARYHAGIYCREDLSVVKETHAWASIYLPPFGWLGVDPTQGRFNESTRLARFAQLAPQHIELWHDRLDGIRAKVFSPDGVKLDDQQSRISYQCTPIDLWDPHQGKSWRESLPFPDLEVDEWPPPGDEVLTSRVKEAASAYESAMKFSSAGDRASAEVQLSRALDYDPGFWPAYRQRIALAQETGQLPALVKEMDSDSKDYRLPVQFLAWGVALLFNQDYRESARALDRCIALGGDDFVVHHNRGMFFLRTKQISLALGEWAHALRDNPKSALTWRDLISLFVSLEDWDGAARAAQAALAVIPQDEFYADLGQARLHLKEYDQAIEALESAIELNPGVGWYHALLGWAAHLQGKSELAARELRLALSLDLGPEEAVFFAELLRKNEKTATGKSGGGRSSGGGR